ncbi:MAG: hypothetical protein AB1796_15450 [Bacillota bacterium]
MEIPVLRWIFQAVPECLAAAALALVLASRSLETRSVFLIGLPQAVAAYLVRLLPLTFGVHTIVLIVVMAALLNVLLEIKLSRSLLVALVVLIILVAVEMVFISLMTYITGITFQEASRVIILSIVYGWPHTVFLFLLALVIYRWQISRHLKKGVIKT